MIIYSCLLKSSQIYNMSAPPRWGTPELKESYAHMILGPMERKQGVMSSYGCVGPCIN